MGKGAQSGKPTRVNDADRRRQALQALFDRYLMSVADVAKATGVNANSLYNFLRGHSESLSISSIEKLGSIFTSEEITSLISVPSTSDPTAESVVIRGVVNAGVWRHQFEIDKREQRPTFITYPGSLDKRGIFALRVDTDGGEGGYPRGTILVCQPPSRFEGKLKPGSKVIVQRIRSTMMQVTIQEMVLGAEGGWWLVARSDVPEHCSQIKLPAFDVKLPWRSGGDRIAVAAVVLSAHIYYVGEG